MLSRLDEKVRHENDLKREVIELINQYKYVFVLCSSTDMERLATFYSTNKQMKSRPFVCDDFQESLLKVFSETAGRKSKLFSFEKPYVFRKEKIKLLEWMQDKGFCMTIRATDKFEGYLDYILPKIDENNTVLIYSMWKEYINPKSKHLNKRYQSIADRFKNLEKIHTSGHASAKCLTDICKLVNPKSGIIPIHSEKSSRILDLPLGDELRAKVLVDIQKVDDVIIELS